MPPMPRPSARILGYGLLFVAAIVVGAELARPFRSASVAFDSQAAVLYFDRIVSGSRLEAFISTTPKPLLTLVFGLLHSAFHDWRALAWITLATNGLAIVLAAGLAHRLGGAIAAAFVGLALVDNASLLFDVGFALATPFALLGWAIAGLAITAPRPRYAIAGLGLAFAALARVETLVVVGVAIVAIGWASWAPRRYRVATPPRGAWLLPAVGLLALPVMLVHDLLLTGDPLYWMGVAGRFAAQTTAHVPTPLEIAEDQAVRYWGMGALTLLAVVGAVRLVMGRHLGIVIGLVGLGPGIAAFLVLLAMRGVFVPIRYVAPVDVAVIFAAGLGVAAIGPTLLRQTPLDRWAGRLPGRGEVPAVVGAAGVLAVLLSGPYWLVNDSIRTTVRESLELAIDADTAVPVISAELAATGRMNTADPRVLAASAIRPRLIVDLDLPIPAVGTTAAARLDPAGGYPAPGQVVLHSRAGDADAEGWATLETDVARTVGAVTLDPLLADPVAGLWVIAIR
jgi:hypothetical protein